MRVALTILLSGLITAAIVYDYYRMRHKFWKFAAFDRILGGALVFGGFLRIITGFTVEARLHWIVSGVTTAVLGLAFLSLANLRVATRPREEKSDDKSLEG